MEDLANGNRNDSSPLTSSHDYQIPGTHRPGSPVPQSISSEEIIRLHSLPSILSRLHIADLVRLAYACEVRNALAESTNTAERQYRQVILVARSYEMRMVNAQSRLHDADDELRHIVDTAVRSASSISATNGVRHDAHPHSARSTRLCPSPSGTLNIHMNTLRHSGGW
jgi:hypothetical protein